MEKDFEKNIGSEKEEAKEIMCRLPKVKTSLHRNDML